MPFWDNKKILVTGGAGLTGSHLVDRSLNERDNVILLDNFDPFYNVRTKRKNIEHNPNGEEFELKEGDIRAKKELEGIFKEYDINKIVHLAAKAGALTAIKNPLIYEDGKIIELTSLLGFRKNRRWIVSSLVHLPLSICK